MCKLIKFKIEKNKTGDGLYFTMLEFNPKHILLAKKGLNIGYCFDFSRNVVKSGRSWPDFEVNENKFNVYFSDNNDINPNMRGNHEFQEIFYLGISALNRRCEFKPLYNRGDFEFWRKRIIEAFKALSDYGANKV